MTLIKCLTSMYIESEDRIRLDGEMFDGTTQTLWLTRRLLDRLIPHLTLWLERQHGDLPRADLLMELVQQKAQANLSRKRL